MKNLIVWATVLSSLFASTLGAQDASDVHEMTLEYLANSESTLEQVGAALDRIPADGQAVLAEVVSDVWPTVQLDGPALLGTELDSLTWQVSLFDSTFAERGEGRINLVAPAQGSATQPLSSTVERLLVGRLSRLPASLGGGATWVLAAIPRETVIIPRGATAPARPLEIIKWSRDEAEIADDLDAFLTLEIGTWESDLESETDAWMAVVDEFGTAGNTRGACVDPECVSRCGHDFQIDKFVCTSNRIDCLESAAATSAVCAFGCAALPVGAPVCLAVCLANHLRMVRGCNVALTQCMRTARIGQMRCVRGCIP